MEAKDLHNRLFKKYDSFYQKGFDTKYLPHNKLIFELSKHAESKIISVGLLGQSFEGREIFKLKAGNGKISVLLWSQMHGDESTATRALLDVFAFFNHTNDEFDKVRQAILHELNLVFVPMLNPDGAERWQRRTAQDIDLNRDALSNFTPEGKLLQTVFKSTQPHYAFNLHDQASYYTVAPYNNPATISLLAPPVNVADTIPENRKRSMQLVCMINNILQHHIPNSVGKWNDDYEPRAFGEHFQKQGAATILIESGGRQNDPERNFARKLNFVILISSLYSIATGSFLKENISTYKQIPINIKEGIFDIIYKNVTIKRDNAKYKCDIGIRFTEKLNDKKQLVYTPVIDDIGDLSPFAAYKTINAQGKEIINQNNMPIKIGLQANLKLI